MASAELLQFLEDRLIDLDPSMDLSPGSPAQTKFLQPVVDYLGTDPFETDIEKFITDRFSQEFPDIYADDPGALRDVFVNPLRLILEPFKRETQSIKRSQSLKDPSLLSDDDADALVANLFDSRDEGGFSVGSVRLYFSNPIDVRVEVSSRAYSRSNLNFFPTSAVTLSAESMAFNREGSFFFMDVPLRAEKAGSEYNIDVDELAGMEGVPNVVKLSNLRRFTGGTPRQDTVTFVTAAEQSLTERSLITRRGAPARLATVFKGAIRATQVVGAKDPEMQRDLLVAASPGHAWITGRVELYQAVAYVQARTIDGALADVPRAGDTLYVYLRPQDFTGATQASRFVRLQVEELYFSGAIASGEFQYAYFIRWSDPEGNLPAAATLPFSFEGGFSKKGRVKISSLPDIGDVDLSVDNGACHIFGRTDLYVRPTTQAISKAVVDGLYDLGKLGSTPNNPHFYLERLTLQSLAGSNAVFDQYEETNPSTHLPETKHFDFAQAGVQGGDVLSVEEGPDAGFYTIRNVLEEEGVSTLYLSQKLTVNSPSSGLRYRVLKKIRINPFEASVARFPFGDVVQNDLRTTIGSTLATLTQNDLLQYGVQVGDTFRIKDGPDKGDYTIKNFDATLGGQGVYLDRALTSTSFSLSYEVFTPLESVELPLVRIRELLLLDSAKQSTGLTVPPADPVAIVPTSDFTSAKVLGKSQLASGYVLPALRGLLPTESIAAQDDSDPTTISDRRYSLGIDSDEGGVYLPMRFGALPTCPQGELLFPPDCLDTSCYFLTTVEQIVSLKENFPPIDPKPGECLTIKNGPNKGSYLIEKVRKFEFQGGICNGQVCDRDTRCWIYFIKIYGSFPVDPLRRVIDFLQEHEQATGLESPTFPLPFPDFFNDPSTGWYTTLGDRLASALGSTGLSDVLSGIDLQAVIEAMNGCYYEWGIPARGVLRSYFREPTLFEMNTGTSNEVTNFVYTTETGVKAVFRPDPVRYLSHEIIPARVDVDADPTSYPRDLDSSDTDTPVFTDFPSKLSIFSSGVEQGDVLSVHEERFLYGDKRVQAVVQTVAGSQRLIVPDAAGDVFTPNMQGDLLFLEEGDEAGGYRITKVLDARTITIDRVLQASTPLITKQGTGASYSCDRSDPDNPKNMMVATSQVFTDEDVGSFVTFFGIDWRYMGSFEISEVSNKNQGGYGDTLSLTTQEQTFFPDTPGTTRWLLTAAPSTAPAVAARETAAPGTAPTGTELVAAVPIRIYNAVPTNFPFLTIRYDEVASSGTVSGDVLDGVAQPYRIYRPNVRRVSPTEMSENRDGFLYFFDTEVVSLSPSSEANLDKESYLVAENYDSLGYRHAVEDPNFTYSTLEKGFLDLSLQILPVGSADSVDNMVRLVGTPVQISYERADLVQFTQELIDSSDDRVMAAGLLARHFLPAYVSYDATYSGGTDASVIAKDISSYIDQLPVESPLDVSVMENYITDHGGNPDTPTKVSATIYDWDRRMWVEFSENQLGGALPTDTKVPYNGSPRVTFFSPGQDVSGVSEPPPGERINLIRR